jgi:hypothetical protein
MHEEGGGADPAKKVIGGVSDIMNINNSLLFLQARVRSGHRR